MEDFQMHALSEEMDIGVFEKWKIMARSCPPVPNQKGIAWVSFAKDMFESIRSPHE